MFVYLLKILSVGKSVGYDVKRKKVENVTIFEEYLKINLWLSHLSSLSTKKVCVEKFIII